MARPFRRPILRARGEVSVNFTPGSCTADSSRASLDLVPSRLRYEGAPGQAPLRRGFIYRLQYAAIQRDVGTNNMMIVGDARDSDEKRACGQLVSHGSLSLIKPHRNDLLLIVEPQRQRLCGIRKNVVEIIGCREAARKIGKGHAERAIGIPYERERRNIS